MQPEDLIRAAAQVLKEGEWCQGRPIVDGPLGGRVPTCHARNHAGEAISLFRGDNSGQDKARVNPDAAALTIYGALVKAQHAAGTSVANPGLMWDTMYRMAIAETGHPPGGANYVHPVIQFNEVEGRTKDEVLAFLEKVAVEIETNGEDAALTPGARRAIEMNREGTVQ